MSDRTTSPSASQSQIPAAIPATERQSQNQTQQPNPAAPAVQLPPAVLATAFGQEAQQRGPAWAAALLADYNQAVVLEGLPEAEYLEGIQTWGAGLETYLAVPAADEQPATVEAAGDAGAERVAEQAAQAAAEEEARQEAAREEADATLKAAVKSYRQGEKAYRAGLLEAGRLAGVYIAQRLALGDKRAAAVQVLEGALATYSSTAVDVNRLVACYQAYRLLAEESGLATAPGKGKPAPADAVPYGCYRDAWARLVIRQAKDTAQECWVLLPGLEADCRAAFAKAVDGGLGKQAVEDMARTIQAHAEAAAAEGARRAKCDAEAAARQAELEAKRQREELAVKAAEVRRALEAAKTAAPEQQSELAANCEAARVELLAQQRETVAAEERERLAKAEQARRETEAAEATKRQLEAESKKAAAERKRAEREAAKGGEKPASVEGTPGTKPQPAAESKPPMGNLIQAARAAGQAGVAKDVASMAAELLTGCETPDDALEALLGILTAHPEMSKASKRACQAGLLVLKRQESPSPARVAEVLERPATVEPPAAVNGTVTAGAA